MPEIGIIGSGFSGLSAACFSAMAGNEVKIFEKNHEIGGRARVLREDGFVFDMGPSWYWMPDVFESFFNQFGKTTANYFELIKLNPSFQIFFKDKQPLIVPAEMEELYAMFEEIEKGSAIKLKKFMEEGERKYNVAMGHLIYKPALSWLEYMSIEVISAALGTNLFKSMSAYVRSFFKDERLIALMEFPVIFLGAMPDRIPSLYSLMNFAAFSMGTFYPKGGMFKIIEGMQQLAKSLGVEIYTDMAIDKIEVEKGKVISLKSGKKQFLTDAVIASADYHHVENTLLEASNRNYKSKYWEKMTMAPSCLIFYLGVNKRIEKLLHHNLFFDTDFNAHAEQIYTKPQWPDDPLFYVCCPSKTDNTVAPEGCENLFILMPLAVGLTDGEALREEYFEKIMLRLEKICGEKIKEKIIYKKSYCSNNFVKDYNAFRGNAYGLANTLNQTAVFKPSIKNKKVSNLFYTGQLTVPGPGVPPALISGRIATDVMMNFLKTNG